MSESSAGAITSNLSYLASKMAISSNAQFISASTTYQQLGFVIVDLLKEGGDSAVINFFSKNRENVMAIPFVMAAAAAIGIGIGKGNIPYLSHLQREEAGRLFMPNTCAALKYALLTYEMLHAKHGEKSMVRNMIQTAFKIGFSALRLAIGMFIFLASGTVALFSGNYFELPKKIFEKSINAIKRPSIYLAKTALEIALSVLDFIPRLVYLGLLMAKTIIKAPIEAATNLLCYGLVFLVKASCSLIASALNLAGQTQKSQKIQDFESTCVNFITTKIVVTKFRAAKNIDKISTFFKNNLYRNVRREYGNLKTASEIWKNSSDTVSEKLQNKKLEVEMQPVQKAKQALEMSLQQAGARAAL